MATEMKERPILFSGEMVRAILAGRKTQTRRVVKPQPEYVKNFTKNSGEMYHAWKGKRVEFSSFMAACPYGQPGDRLWVRETWCNASDNGLCAPCDNYPIYRASDPEYGTECDGWRWKPSIFMPRKASRITLEVAGVRVERLNEISEKDSAAEGIGLSNGSATGQRYYEIWTGKKWACNLSSKNVYMSLWEDINGPGSWASNPWVWVIEFKKQEAKNGG